MNSLLNAKASFDLRLNIVNLAPLFSADIVFVQIYCEKIEGLKLFTNHKIGVGLFTQIDFYCMTKRS